MKIKFLVDEDFVNYKEPSMFVGFPYCSMKCGEACQNKHLLDEPCVSINIGELVDRYINNSLTTAVVCGGLEPFDSWGDLYKFIELLRKYTDDTVVIYTGYNSAEIHDKEKELVRFKNIIIKYGRYRENDTEYYSPVLGVTLASNNQYANKIS